MKLILFGDIPNWNRSIQLLQTYRPDIFIAGLSSVSLGQFASSSVTYTPEETAALYRSHQIDGVINIQGENPYYFRLLKELGIENIYVIPHTLYQKLELSESIDDDAILYPYKEVLPELMQLEFHLADHCNLNCNGCSHFPTSCHSLSFQIKNSLYATFSSLPAISRRFMIFICLEANRY